MREQNKNSELDNVFREPTTSVIEYKTEPIKLKVLHLLKRKHIPKLHHNNNNL